MNKEYEGISPEIEEDERRESQADALIVFGFGIKDPNWMQKRKEAEEAGVDPETISDQSEGWMLSLGAKMRVQAAAELYLKGATREVIFTGGATRTKDGLQQTEAQVMEDYFLHILRKRKFEQLKGDRVQLSETERRDIDVVSTAYIQEAKTHIIKEDKASNTIENFSRTLAMFDNNPNKYKKIALLSSKFHIDRIGQLSEQFLLPADEEYGAEEVMAESRKGKRHEALYTDVLNDYLESEEYYNFTLRENQWRGGLRKVPEYFLPQTIFVDIDRFREILRSMALQDEVYANKLSELGINPDSLDDLSEEQLNDIKNKIESIERILPPQSWAEVNPEQIFATPPARFEKRSEYTDPLERARHLETLIFSDVDGTLRGEGANDRLVGEYIRLAERCSGEIILTSSRSRGDLETLKDLYRMNELAPVIFENGAGVAFDNRLVDIGMLKQIASEEGFSHVNFVSSANTTIVEFSPSRQSLRPVFDEVAKETGLKYHYVLDLPAQDIAELYNISLEQAEDIKQQVPREEKLFMENIVFEESASEDEIQEFALKAKDRGLHLTRARITWHLMSSNVNKGEAVRFVQKVYKHLSQNYRLSVAVGDAPNDFEMFKQCDEAYYVGDDKYVVEGSHETEKKRSEGVIELIRNKFLNMREQ